MNEKRAAGVLAPVFSLPSGYSSGNFGRCAYEFVDVLKESGFSYWQVLPFTVPDRFHSPYASSSSFSVNPLFLDPEDLLKRGLLTKTELASAREYSERYCEYTRLEKERAALLSLAAERFDEQSALDAFLQSHPYTAEYCCFEGLKAANGGVPWQHFQTDTPDMRVYRTYAVLSYLFYEQWKALRDYAHKRKVSVIGDLPIYVSLDSADVYFHPELFALTEEGYPRGVAGVPPDYFSETGQKWGNPLYDWEKMKEDGFSFWRARMNHMLELFDGVRLDHFRGFDTYFDIPYAAPDAKSGVWREGPRYAIIDALKEEAKGALLIAEDLGELFPSVRELLAYSGFPGMRVFAFAFDGEDSPHHPDAYSHSVIAYSGTHDNDTLIGFLSKVSQEKLEKIFGHCGYEGKDLREGARVALEKLYASKADLLVLPVQDLLFLGSEARLNTPGTTTGNWCFRFTKEEMRMIDKEYFRSLAVRFGR